MTSEARREANRRNAQKSTGPKTPEGKAASARNGLKHGLAGMGSVLPPGDEELFAERMQAWTAQEQPRGAIETYMLATAALASVRLDRCARNEFAAIAQKRRATLRNWQRRQDRRIKRILKDFADDHTAARAELEDFASGCGWLVELWQDLLEALDEPAGWNDEQLDRAAGWLDDPARLRALALSLRTAAEKDTLAERELRALVQAEIDRLAQARHAHWFHVEGPALAEQLDLATIDLSRDGALRHRYAVAATSELHRALTLLARREKQSVAERRAEDRAAKAHAHPPAPDPVAIQAWFRGRHFVDPGAPAPTPAPAASPEASPAAGAPVRTEANASQTSADLPGSCVESSVVTTAAPDAAALVSGASSPPAPASRQEETAPPRPPAGP